MHKVKTNFIVCTVMLGFAVAFFFFFPRMSSAPVKPVQVTEDTVVISVGGEEKLRVPLSQPQTVTISQPSGEENVIVVTDHGVYMERSTCRNQICVHSGNLTVDNYDLRSDGPFIICLPNQVSIELVVFSE